MFSLLANTHDLKNKFQKLNEIHRRRPSNCNRHTDWYFCRQIPTLSPGISYDQQCYQWFNGFKLTCFMDTYPSSSADQSNKATQSAVKWSLSDRFMSNPDCIFYHSDGCKKVKKGHYWTIEPPFKFEFGGGETVIKTAEAKHKSWFPSMDQG